MICLVWKQVNCFITNWHSFQQDTTCTPVHKNSNIYLWCINQHCTVLPCCGKCLGKKISIRCIKNIKILPTMTYHRRLTSYQVKQLQRQFLFWSMHLQFCTKRSTCTAYAYGIIQVTTHLYQCHRKFDIINVLFCCVVVQLTTLPTVTKFLKHQTWH